MNVGILVGLLGRFLRRFGDGFLVVLKVGDNVGSSVGYKVGISVGASVGYSVESSLGESVGNSVKGTTNTCRLYSNRRLF